MKNLLKSSFILLAVASMTFLASCGDEEEPAPDGPTVSVSVEVNGTDATSPFDVEVGDELTFNASTTTAGGFNVIRIYLSTDGGTSSSAIGEASRTDLSLDEGTIAADVTLSFTIPDNFEPGDELTFEVEVVDDLNQIATTTVEANVISPEARSYTAVLLSVPSGNFENENFFSVASGEIYSRSEVNSTSEAISPTIDFGYYYGVNEKASIASPEGFKSTVFSDQVSGWGTTNATVLKTTTIGSSEFLEVSTFAEIEAEFDAGTADDNGIINGLEVGDVLAFETVGGVKGLILVTSIDLGTDGTGYGSDASIEIEVIAQLDAE
ncbi:hypothetical protein [Marinoscillum pacificum]|uniref:hypothetical protein n=1 Tax=Marinoscillum pacificum TaxID=392723 RepID=UPI002157A548|nr:hypothetical protein [Marinoscillum pacificum]